MDELRILFSDYSLEPWNRFTAGLVAAMAVARLLDFLSTWIVTPKLELEANPLMRRLRWGRMALINVPLLGLPFLHAGLAITFIVTSLLAAGSNFIGGALAKGMGERRQLESQVRALREIGLLGALTLNSTGALIICLGGGFLMALAERVENHAWWGGLGVVMFGLVGLVHYNIAILRLSRKAGKQF